MLHSSSKAGFATDDLFEQWITTLMTENLMAWNEPGGNNQDPWGGGKKGNDLGPPDLDEA